MKRHAILGSILVIFLMMSGNVVAIEDAYADSSTSKEEYYYYETVVAYVDWAPYDPPNSVPGTFVFDWANITIYMVPGNESGDPVHVEKIVVATAPSTWPGTVTFYWDQTDDGTHEPVERGWYHIEPYIEGEGHIGEEMVPFMAWPGPFWWYVLR